MIATHRHELTIEKSHDGERWAWDYIRAWQDMGYKITREDAGGVIIIRAEIAFAIGEGPVA